MPNHDDLVIGFDYGLTNIGVAVGRPSSGRAEPLACLKAREGIPNWDEIQKLIAEWKPVSFVVGLPLNMDNSENDMCARARKFANRVRGRFGIDFDLMDERLSSHSAKQDAAERGQQWHHKKRPIDSIAAQYILESWFSHQIHIARTAATKA